MILYFKPLKHKWDLIFDWAHDYNSSYVPLRILGMNAWNVRIVWNVTWNIITKGINYSPILRIILTNLINQLNVIFHKTFKRGAKIILSIVICDSLILCSQMKICLLMLNFIHNKNTFHTSTSFFHPQWIFCKSFWKVPWMVDLMEIF
jgi:hypothetical protein